MRHEGHMGTWIAHNVLIAWYVSSPHREYTKYEDVGIQYD